MVVLMRKIFGIMEQKSFSTLEKYLKADSEKTLIAAGQRWYPKGMDLDCKQGDYVTSMSWELHGYCRLSLWIIIVCVTI